VERLEAGFFENPCPRCGEDLEWLPVGEEEPLRPRSGYAAGKVAQEHYAGAWARSTGSRVIALRYHNVYGPGMPRETPYAGVAALFASALARGEAPRVFEDGAQLRDFVHVADVARANVLALERDAPATGAYNIASGSPRSVGDMARALAAAYDGCPEPVVTGEFRRGDVRHVFASPTRARDVLGFEATIMLEEGMREFAHAPLRRSASRRP
jgi:dTDP-L-rhamnose 4-epimerase